MPKVIIEYSEDSVEDMRGIFAYIAQDSVTNALSIIDRMEQAIEKLEENPELGMSCRRKRVRFSCRILIVGAYLIVYRYSNQTVRVLRVLRDKQNYIGLMFNV